MKTEMYNKMAKAITFMRENSASKPDLSLIAQQVGMHPEYFQKVFTQWAGISPKQLMQLTDLENAKLILKQKQLSLFETALDIGLSGSSRLHDLFVKIERMRPGEYRNGAKGLKIKYIEGQTLLGNILIAETETGICKVQFYEDFDEAFKALREEYSYAEIIRSETAYNQTVIDFFNDSKRPLEAITVHLKGTDFQLKVWEALLKIPEGYLETYSGIAKQIQHSKAVRAVGTAIGANPLAYIIPCHRVIREGGQLGGYRWGLDRKALMLGIELSK